MPGRTGAACPRGASGFRLGSAGNVAIAVNGCDYYRLLGTLSRYLTPAGLEAR
jgi:hypothetical protein